MFFQVQRNAQKSVSSISGSGARYQRCNQLPRRFLGTLKFESHWSEAAGNTRRGKGVGGREETPPRLGILSWSNWKQFTLILSQIQDIWGKWFPHFSSINQCGYSWQALLLAGWAAESQARGLSPPLSSALLCRCSSFPVCLTANYFSRRAPSTKKTAYILESNNCTEIQWEKSLPRSQLLHKISWQHELPFGWWPVSKPCLLRVWGALQYFTLFCHFRELGNSRDFCDLGHIQKFSSLNDLTAGLGVGAINPTSSDSEDMGISLHKSFLSHIVQKTHKCNKTNFHL